MPIQSAEVLVVGYFETQVKLFLEAPETYPIVSLEIARKT